MQIRGLNISHVCPAAAYLIESDLIGYYPWAQEGPAPQASLSAPGYSLDDVIGLAARPIMNATKLHQRDRLHPLYFPASILQR